MKNLNPWTWLIRTLFTLVLLGGNFEVANAQGNDCGCVEVNVTLDAGNCTFKLTAEILGLGSTCPADTRIQVEDTNPGNGNIIDAPGLWTYFLLRPAGDTICSGKVRAQDKSGPVLMPSIGRCGRTVTLSESYPVWRDTFLESDREKIFKVESSWKDSTYPWYAGTAVFKDACDHPEIHDCPVSVQVEDKLINQNCPQNPGSFIIYQMNRLWIGRDCFGNETRAIQEIYFVQPDVRSLRQQYAEQGDLSGLRKNEKGMLEWEFRGAHGYPPDKSVMLDSFLANNYIFESPFACTKNGSERYAYFKQAQNAGRGANILVGIYSFAPFILEEVEECKFTANIVVRISVFNWCKGADSSLDTILIKWHEDNPLACLDYKGIPPVVIAAKPGACAAEFGIDSLSLREFFGVHIKEPCTNFPLRVFVESCVDESGKVSGTSCYTWCALGYPTRWENGRLMVKDVPAGAHRLVLSTNDYCGETFFLGTIDFEVTSEADTACQASLCANWNVGSKLVKLRGRCDRPVVPNVVSSNYIDPKSLIWRDTFLSTDLQNVWNVPDSWQKPNYRYFAGSPVFLYTCSVFDKPDCDCPITLDARDHLSYYSCETMIEDQIWAKITRTFTASDCLGDTHQVVQELFFVWPALQPLGVKEIALNQDTCFVDNATIVAEMKKRYYVFDDPFGCYAGEKYAYFPEAEGRGDAYSTKLLDSRYRFDAVLTDKEEALCNGGRKLEVVIKVFDACTGLSSNLDTLWVSWVDLTPPEINVQVQELHLIADSISRKASFAIDSLGLEEYFGVSISETCERLFTTAVDIESFTRRHLGNNVWRLSWEKGNYPVQWVNFGDTVQRMMVYDVPVGEHRVFIQATDGCSNQSTVVPVPLTVTRVSCKRAAIATQPANQYIREGGSATFRVKVAGMGPFTFQWRKNGAAIPGANQPVYTTPPLQLSDDKSSYTCQISNCSGDSIVLSREAQVFVGCGCPEVEVKLASASSTYRLTHEILGNTHCGTEYSIYVADNSPQNGNLIDGPGSWTYVLFDKNNVLFCLGKARAVIGCDIPATPVPFNASASCQGIDISTNPILNWASVSGAEGYRLSLSKYPYGSVNRVPLQNNGYVTDTSYSEFTALQPGVPYQWNVQAVTSRAPACESGKSAARFFYIPPQIMPTAQVDGTVVLATTAPMLAAPAEVRYQWYMDGSPVGENAPVLTASEPGMYMVQLKFSGSMDCDTVSMMSTPFVVQKFPHPFLPPLQTELPKKIGANTGNLDTVEIPNSTRIIRYSGNNPDSRITRAEAYRTDSAYLEPMLAITPATPLRHYALYQNIPNPFSGETLIGFWLPEAGEATLTIRDVTGRTLRVIRGQYGAGYNQELLRSEDLRGRGLLFYSLTSGAFRATRRMVVE